MQKFGATAKAEIFNAQNIKRFRCSDSLVSFAFRTLLRRGFLFRVQCVFITARAVAHQRCFAQTCPWQLCLWSVTTNKLDMRCVEISFRPKLQFVIKIFQYFSLKVVVFCDFGKTTDKSDMLSRNCQGLST